MKLLFSALLLSLFASTLGMAAPKVRWPKDAIEWKDIEKKAKEQAAKEKKAIAVIFIPAVWGDDEDGGVSRSVDATNDAIRALKTYCVISKGNLQVALEAHRTGNKEKIPKALLEGLFKAGRYYPQVVVLDAEMKSVLGAVGGDSIYKEGKKVFREAKKKFRELGKAKEEKDD